MFSKKNHEIAVQKLKKKYCNERLYFFSSSLIEVRVSPVQFQQHSPQYYRQTSDESIKSESPSRKRRRLSRSGHHIELNAQPPSPPRRSPRQHPPSTPHHAMQVSFVVLALV